jgi:hypothetical protein
MFPAAFLMLASVVIFSISPTNKRSTSNVNPIAATDLSEVLSSSYGNHGVSGVLNLCQYTNVTKAYAPHDLVQAALDIQDKGTASGVLDAMIGSCCLKLYNSNNNNSTNTITTTADKTAAEFALELFYAYDAATTLKPDIVTLALTYTASFQENPAIANEILSRSKELIVTTPNENNGQPLLYHQTDKNYPDIRDIVRK